MYRLLLVLTTLIFTSSVNAQDNIQPNTRVGATFYKQSKHFSPRYYYNEKEHDFFSVTINDWQVGVFNNSFREDTRFIMKEFRKRYKSRVEGYTGLMWVNGYSDAQNMVVPVFGLRFGPQEGAQFEMEIIPGALTWGYKIIFWDRSRNNK